MEPIGTPTLSKGDFDRIELLEHLGHTSFTCEFHLVTGFEVFVEESRLWLFRLGVLRGSSVAERVHLRDNLRNELDHFLGHKRGNPLIGASFSSSPSYSSRDRVVGRHLDRERLGMRFDHNDFEFTMRLSAVETCNVQYK